MARSVVLLVSGAIVGAASVYLLNGSGPDPVQAPQEPIATGPLPAVAATQPQADAGSYAADVGGHVSERVAIYEQAARATDSFDLEAMIRLAASDPVSLSRDLEIEALLARLAEIDPERAVRFARSIYLETRFLIPAFETLARADADTAIVELSAVASPATRRRIAVALLGVVGYEAGIARVAAALPAADRVSFGIDALAARAETDPSGALEAALGLESLAVQRLVLPRIAEAAGRVDPLGALALAGAIDESFRTVFTNALLTAWAGTDPEGVFVYLEAADRRELSASLGAFQALAANDPERVLAVVDGLPATERRLAQQMALRALAEVDPLAALARLDSMPPGQDRTSMLQSIAQVYGRDDPDAALAWASSLTPASEEAMTGVVRGIAQVDIDRALDLILADLDSEGLPPTSPLSLILAISPADTTSYVRVADRLTASENPLTRSMFQVVMSRWASTDANGALDWALANAERLDANVFRSLAQQAARTSPQIAMSTLDRLPPDRRGGWIEGVSQELAQSDLDGALGFLERYRGQPGYDSGMANVIGRVAQDSPEAAIRLLGNLPPGAPQLRSATANIARYWAERDPRAAADWALGLADPGARTTSTQVVAQLWAQRDLDGARGWTLALPSGAVRDGAISALVGATARTGTLDTQLLAALGTDQARQQAARSSILTIGRSDMDEARRLMDLHIQDPLLRRQMEEQLARTGGAGGSTGVISTGGGVIIF